jgi:hypothetical protein
MHPILNLKPDWSYAQTDEPLKQTLVQTSLWRFLTHYDWSKLTVITHQNDMLSAFEDGDQRFWLGSLSCFIDENLLELQRFQSLIKSWNASCTNYISVSKNLIFCLPFQIFKCLIVFLIQFSVFLPLRHELLHSSKLIMFQMFDLLMERYEVHVWTYALSRSCAKSHHLESGAVDFVRQLIYCYVWWSTDQNFSHFLFHEMVNQGCGGHGFSSTWGALNESQRRCQRFFYRVHLEMIKLRHSFDG